MSKKNKTSSPVASDFNPQAGFGSEDATGADPAPVESEPTATEDAPEVEDVADPRDAEIARLRAELAASRGPTYEAGRKYRVSIKDGPTAIVQPQEGEHPFEAFKRLSGVLKSDHAPEVQPAADSAKVGIVPAA